MKVAQKETADTPLKKLLFTVFGSLVGVLVAAVVGDMMVKRNVDSYWNDLNSLKKDIAAVNTEYKALDADIVSIVSARRLLAREMNLYISQGDVAKGAERFPTYVAVVKSWNDQSGSIRNRIKQATRCDAPWPAEYDLNDKIAAVIRGVNVMHGLNAMASEQDVTSTACPDSLVFGGRTDVTTAADGFRSTFEVLRYMHTEILESFGDAVVSCVAVARDMFVAEAANCRGQKAVSWNYTYSAVPECVRSTALAYSPNIICRDRGFGRQAGIEDGKFLTADYWWHLGRQVLSAYRTPALLRTCRDHQTGWPKLFGPSCEKLLSEMGI